MNTKNISIDVGGHKFKFWPGATSKHCESCGMGYETYLNLGQKCRNWAKAEDEKLVIFGWIVTILGIPEKANPTQYNQLTDKLYEIMEFRR